MPDRPLTISNTIPRVLRLWPLLLPLLLLIPALPDFPYSNSDAAYSDLTISHYPNTVFLRDALRTYRALPLWSPLILSGAPFAANPLSGIWYPAGWLALLFPLPFGFNLTVLLHFLWLGIGMYVLLRREILSYPAAMLGAMAVEALPKMFAHYGAGHLTLLYAIPWTPWLLWSARFHPHSSGRSKALFRILPGVIMALIFLADVRWAVYAGVLWWAYAFWYRNPDHSGSGLKSLRNTFVILLQQTITAAMLAAPLALMLWEFTRLSSRVLMTSEESLTFSLPPERLLGLIYPDFSGFHEWTVYVGGAILILSLLAISWSRTQPGSRFWIWVAIIGILFSLGSFLPFFGTLARLPVFNLLRVPSRALFLMGFALAALAAYATQRLMTGPEPFERRRGSLIITALAGFVFILAVGIWVLLSELPQNFAWGSGIIVLGGIWIGLRLAGRMSGRVWLLGLLVLCLIDWSMINRSLFTPRSPEIVFAESRAVAQSLADKDEDFRSYSPSYSLAQQTAVNYDLMLSDGVDPLQLQSYVAFMEEATGVPQTGYSVTLPPFADGDPETANAKYQPNPELLGLLNVRYIAAEYDLDVEGVELAAQYGATRLYENKWSLPRAWVQPGDTPPGWRARPAEITLWEPNRITIGAEGPGTLVLSEVDYPGWQVWVDGEQDDIQVIAGLLRGVSIGSGLHEVEFVFRPVSLYLGLVVMLAGFMIITIQFARAKDGQG